MCVYYVFWWYIILNSKNFYLINFPSHYFQANVCVFFSLKLHQLGKVCACALINIKVPSPIIYNIITKRKYIKCVSFSLILLSYHTVIYLFFTLSFLSSTQHKNIKKKTNNNNNIKFENNIKRRKIVWIWWCAFLYFFYISVDIHKYIYIGNKTYFIL